MRMFDNPVTFIHSIFNFTVSLFYATLYAINSMPYVIHRMSEYLTMVI